MQLEAPCVLVISAGISDVQPLIVTEDGQRRRALVQHNNRRWHEAILSGEIAATISHHEADATLPEVPVVMPPSIFDATAPLSLPASPERYATLVRQTERLVLVAPKLFALWQQIRASSSVICGCLVLYTHRAASTPFAQEEPVAVGKLLCDWFRPLCHPGASIEPLPYLLGTETLEDENRGLALSAQPAARIEAALRRLYRAQPGACVLLAADGGPPPVKEHLEATTTLFFPPERVLRYQRTVLIAGTTRSNPGLTDAVRARTAALWHLRHGRFAEAWAQAQPFDRDPAHTSWVNPLFYANELFSRQLIQIDPERGALPASLARIRDRHKSRSLWAALRVESALQRQAWIDAINATITFFDCLMLDAIEKCLPAGVRLDDRKRLVYWPHSIPLPATLCTEDFCVLEPVRPEVYRYDAVGRAQARWLDWLDVPALKALAQALIGPMSAAASPPGHAEPDGPLTPLAYRHLNTHNLLRHDELAQAHLVFVQSGLWAAADAPPGEAFFALPLIREALRWVLDEPDPARVYRDLVHELEHVLLDPAGEDSLPRQDSSGFIAT